MAGKPFKVGRFAHTLRVRLMREHLGIDVDTMYEDDLMAAEPDKETHEVKEWDPQQEQEFGAEQGVTRAGSGMRRGAAMEMAKSAGEQVSQGEPEAALLCWIGF
jgi:phospholipase D1/2